MSDPSNEIAVRLRGLTKRYGQATAVDGIDLDIREGELLTLLGPSGSGKTTTLRMIAGFELPTDGTIHLDGVDVTSRPPFERDVNTVFQDYALFPHMDVADNVGYGLRVRRVPRAERRERVAAALAQVRLERFGDRRPSELSGGQLGPCPRRALRPGGDAGAGGDGRRPLPARHPPRHRGDPPGHVPGGGAFLAWSACGVVRFT